MRRRKVASNIRLRSLAFMLVVGSGEPLEVATWCYSQSWTDNVLEMCISPPTYTAWAHFYSLGTPVGEWGMRGSLILLTSVLMELAVTTGMDPESRHTGNIAWYVCKWERTPGPNKPGLQIHFLNIWEKKKIKTYIYIHLSRYSVLCVWWPCSFNTCLLNCARARVCVC